MMKIERKEIMKHLMEKWYPIWDCTPKAMGYVIDAIMEKYDIVLPEKSFVCKICDERFEMDEDSAKICPYCCTIGGPILEDYNDTT